MANKNRRFVVDLEIDSSTAEKQIKTTAKNFKTILADLGNASDKMTYFKELADYISQIDRQLDAFRNTHGEGMFNKIFGGLDEGLQREMQNLFGTAKDELAALEELKQKVLTAKKDNNTTKDDALALKKATEDLFESFDRLDEIDISNSLGVPKMLEEIEKALGSFATKWKDVNNQVSQGFTFGGRQIDDLKKQQKEIEDILHTIQKDAKVPVELPQTGEKQQKALRKLVEEFNNAKNAKEAFEQSGDTESDEYLRASAKYIVAAKQLKSAFDRNDLKSVSYKYIDTGKAQTAYLDAETGIEEFYNFSKDIFDKIQKLYSKEVQEITSEINKLKFAAPPKPSTTLDELDAMLDDYKEAHDKLNAMRDDDSKRKSSEFTDLQDYADDLENQIMALDKTAEKADDIFDILGDLADPEIEYDKDNAIADLCDLLAIEVPKSADKAKAAMKDFKKSVDGDADSEIINTDSLKAELERVHDLAFQTQKELSFSITSDGVKYVVESLEGVVKASDEAATAVHSLNKGMTILAHSHPGGDGYFSMKDLYSGINAKMSGVNSPVMALGQGMASVLNLDGVTDEVVQKFRQKLDSLPKDAKISPVIFTELQNIFKDNGFENALQKFSISEGTDDLVNFLKEITINAQEAHTPLKQLQSLISYYSNGKLDMSNMSEFDDYWKDFEQGAQNAVEVFDAVMAKLDARDVEGDLIQIGSTEHQALPVAAKNIAVGDNQGGVDDYLGKEIPDAADKANAALELAESKLKEFEALADKAAYEEFYSSDADYKIGKYVQQLDDAKAALEELGKQGLLTTEQLESINEMYNKANDHLQDSRRYYSGYGSYDYSYEYEYEKAQNENEELKDANIERATDKLQEFYNLTERIQTRNIDLLNDQELGNYRGQLELLNNELEALSSQSLLTAEDMERVASAYDEANKKIQTALDEKQKQRDIDSYYEGELYNRVLAAESENRLLREDISDYIEKETELRIENNKLRDQLSRNDEIDESSSDEIAQLEKLEEKIKAVKEAVELKTQAFKDEAEVVNRVVSQETIALDALSTYLDTIYVVINHIVNGLNKINNTKLNDVVDNEEKAVVDNNNINSSTPSDTTNKWALDDTLILTNQILERIAKAVENNEDTTGLITGLEQTIKDLRDAANAIKVNADDFKQKAKDDAKDTSSDDAKDTKKQKTFDEIKNDEVSSFEKYRKDVKNSIHITDEFDEQLDKLQLELANVGDTNGLDAWKQSFKELQSEVNRHESSSRKVLVGQVNAITKEAKDALKGLDLDTLSDDQEKRVNQEKIIQGFKEIQIASDVCTEKIKNNQYTEIKALEETKQQLLEKKQQLLENIHVYKQENNLLNSGGKSGRNYGNTAVIRETTRYNQFKQYRDDQDASFKDSDTFNNALAKYESAYTRLIKLRKEFASKPVLTDHDVQEFNDAKQAAANYGKELDKMIARSNKLAANRFEVGEIGSDINIEDEFSRKQALTEFVTSMHDAKESTIKFSNNYQECMFKMKNSDGTWTRMTAVLDKTSNKMYSTAGEVTKYGTAIGEFVGALKGEFLKLGRYMIASFGIEEVMQAVRTGITYIKEIDDALTELKKVTNETDATYDGFLQTMSQVGSVIGATTAELTNSAADWARLGYSIQEAGELAKNTAILLNVSEFETVEEATEAMVSTLQAFNYEAEDSLQIVDKLNIVGNNFAISSDGIAVGLQKSAAVLVEAGNSLEQSIAMMAAGNKVIQDPDQLGSALKVLSMRIRGTKTELEEMGESTEGMATNTSKLRDQIMALTNINGSGGVDILSASGEYRSTYDILVDIADVYDDIAKKDNMAASALTELLAGKHRANVLAAILQNPEDLKDAYETALDSNGSALAENERYLDSIQGKIDQFINSLQTMWMNTIDSDTAKFVVELGTGLINLVDKFGLLQTAVVGVSTVMLAMKKINPITAIQDAFNQIHNFALAIEKIKELKNSGVQIDLFNFDDAGIQAYAAQVKNLTAKQQAAALAQAGLNKQEIEAVLTKNNVSEATKKQVLAETAAITAKEKDSIVTAGQMKTLMQQKGIKLSDIALNYLTEHSTEEVTEAMLERMVVTGALSNEEKQIIMTTLGMTSANATAITSFKALGAAIKSAFMTNPIGMAIMAITTAISILVPVVSKLHKSQDELNKSAQEVIDTYSNAKEELSTTKSTLDGLTDDFEKLSSGVDQFGNNISLTTDEYKRYNEIVNQIADMFPEMITGYTEEGNAILSCKGDVDALTAAYEAQAQAARQAAIAGSGDVFDTFKTNYSDSGILFNESGLKQQADAARKILELYEKGDYGALSYYINDGNTDVMNDLWESTGIDSSLFGSLSISDTSMEAFEEQLPKLKSYIKSANVQIKAETSKVTSIMEAFVGEEADYQKLETEQQNLINSLIKNLDAKFYDQFEDPESAYAWIYENYIAPFSDPKISKEFNNAIEGMLGTQTDWESGKISLKEYQKEAQGFVDVINGMDVDADAKNGFAELFGFSLEDSEKFSQEIEAMIGHTKTILAEEDWSQITKLDFGDLQILDKLEVEDGTVYSWEELLRVIEQTKEELGTSVTSFVSYSALSSEVENYNKVLSQTSEYVADNVEVSQEYRDSLTALGISEEKLNECFYEGNPLVVKNADALNNLVNETQRNVKANIDLAQAQSRLEYFELVQELNDVCNVTRDLNSEEIERANVIMNQIDLVQDQIYKYQLLKETLSETGQAYQNFKDAQEIDALNKTGDNYVEMAQTIYDAFNVNGQVGTQAFDAAVEALIPDDVYASLESDGDKLVAIYDYFNKKVLPSLTLDKTSDDGAEGTLSIDNVDVENFVEKGLNKGIFDGSAKDGLAAKIGMTYEEAAKKVGMSVNQFKAYLAELEKYDYNTSAESFLSQFDQSFDGQVSHATSKMQELNEEKMKLLASDGGYEKNKERIDEINKELGVCGDNLKTLQSEAVESYEKFADNQRAIEGLETIEDKTRLLTEGEAKALGIKWDEVEGKTVQEALDLLTEKKLKLGEPTELMIQFAQQGVINEIDDLIDKIEKEKKIKIGVTYNKDTGEYEVDENSKYASVDSKTGEIKISGLGEQGEALESSLGTLDSINSWLDDGLVTTETLLGDIKTTLNSLYEEQTGKKAPGEEKKKDTKTSTENPLKPDTVLSNKNPLEFKSNLDGDNLVQELKELGQLKQEYEKISDKSSEKALKKAEQIKAKEKEIAQIRIDGWKESINKIDDISDKDKEIAIKAVTEYGNGGSIDDLLTDLKSIKDEEVRTKVIMELAKSGSFSSLLSELEEGDKKIVIKALTEGTGDVEALNEIISKLPPEVKSQVTTLVDEAVDDLEVVDGKLKKVDNTTAKPEVSTSGVNQTLGYLDDVTGAVNGIPKTAQTKISAPGAIDAKKAVDNLDESVDDLTTTKTVTIWAQIKKKASDLWNKITGGDDYVNGTANINGTAHVGGTAHAGGNWGAKKTETALTGELGPELVVRGNRWFTVGDNGAEFTKIQKGDIIFNHRQTEELLKNGYVTSRGKIQGGSAHAQGTAYAMWSVEKKQPGSSSSSSSYTAKKSGKSKTSTKKTSDYSSDFEEVFDWFEVRMEEIHEDLDLMGAKLENAISYTSKNKILDSMIATNKEQLTTLEKGVKLYEKYASDLLYKIPKAYRDEAKNGKIAIEEFAGAADEKTLEAIKNYREWAQKVADLKVQLQEVKREIEDLAKQKIDTIFDRASMQSSIQEKQNERIQADIDYDEERGYITSGRYYEDMAVNIGQQIDYYTDARKAMQKSLDESVKAGDIIKYSDAWYEAIEQMYEVDALLDECTLSLEEYQNAINQIHWDNFDELINRFDYLQEEVDSLIDLMDKIENPVITPETDDGWSADEVAWSDEGLAQLGLYAEKMELAKYQADKYAEEINYLNKEYKAGKYSETEYLEKLNELKQGQYDSIQAYNDAKDAIVELNEARVDAIKEGIELELEAYSELIDKKKEELDAEKDLYGFRKSVMEQQKDITKLERQLAALSGDNSASARAKKKQLEAELAEARQELKESYYDRSVENQQNALDKELENFEAEKDAEMEALDKYLEDTELVVSDTLSVVAENSSVIYSTLNEKAKEYGLNLSDAVTKPWKDGIFEMEAYEEGFTSTATSVVEQIEKIEAAWQKVIDKMDKAAKAEIAENDKEIDTYTNAEKATTPSKSSSSSTSNKQNSNTTKAAPKKGDTVKVDKSATNFSSKSNNVKMASFVPGGTYTVMQTSGSGSNMQVLIGKNGAVTGWVKLKDLQGYAKGSKEIGKDQWAIIDELGEEMQLVPDGNGRLAYIKKGTGILTADMTERLMNIAMNPQDMLDRNRPSVKISPEVHNTEVNLNIQYGDMLRIENFKGDNPEEIAKIVAKQFEKHTKDLNNSLRKYVR